LFAGRQESSRAAEFISGLSVGVRNRVPVKLIQELHPGDQVMLSDRLSDVVAVPSPKPIRQHKYRFVSHDFPEPSEKEGPCLHARAWARGNRGAT